METSWSLRQKAVIRSLYPTNESKTVEPQRYLATVMFVDVVSFTRLMHENEDVAMQKLAIIRDIIEFFHRTHGGRIIQYYGDGCLSTFHTVNDAVACALAIQQQTKVDEVLPLRIGIHSGEIVEKDGAIYGDTVNITSRVEASGSSQSVLLSDTAYRNITSKGHYEFVDLGQKKFKNIDTPMRVHALRHVDLRVPHRSQKSLFRLISRFALSFLA